MSMCPLSPLIHAILSCMVCRASLAHLQKPITPTRSRKMLAKNKTTGGNDSGYFSSRGWYFSFKILWNGSDMMKGAI